MDERNIVLVCSETGCIIAHLTQSEYDEIMALDDGVHSYSVDGRTICFWKVDGNIVCRDYGDDNYVICDECGRVITDDDYIETVEGDRYCCDCTRRTEVCDRCDAYHNIGCMHDVIIDDCGSTERWCEDCCDDHAYQCEDCCEYVSGYCVTRTYDDRAICPVCYENDYGTCEDCDYVFPYGELVEDEETGRYVCEGCLESIQAERSRQPLVTCVYCGTQVREGLTISVTDENGNTVHVCDSCARRTWICCSCHRSFTDTVTPQIIDGYVVCNHCAETNTFTCQDCGTRILRYSAYNRDGNWYCRSCERNHRPVRVITGYHQYSGSSGPVWLYRGITTPDLQKDLLMGIELEIDDGGTDHDKALKITTALGYPANLTNEFKCTTDGSLNNGFEIISMPATMEYHLSEYKWEAGMQKASQLGYRSHDANTCGLHIHVNRSYFSQAMENPESSILILMCNNRNWLEKFSRRNRWSYCHYMGGGRKFDIEDFKSKDADRQSENLVFLRDLANDCKGHSSMVNFANHATIEFRLFRGTLKYSTFVAALQLVQMMCYASKHFRNEQLVNVDLRWFKTVAERKGYTEFLNYLTERGIMM